MPADTVTAGGTTFIRDRLYTMAAERLRRQLLKDTGITCWFPRAPMPGAAPSHRTCIELADEPAPVPVSRPVIMPSQTPSPQRSAVQVLSTVLAPEPVVVTEVEAHADQPASVLQTLTADIAAPFGFSWFVIDKRLSVLAMLPPGASRLSGSCRLMLERMLVALHAPWQSMVLEEQSFHWPFAEMPELAVDANAAKQAVDGFIARRLRARPSAMLLVLGDEVPWFLRQPDVAHAEEGVGQLLIHRHFEFAMLCTHSLHAMEQDAGLKRAAWQSMQLLRERLGRS
jgi:hypothetical protein